MPVSSVSLVFFVHFFFCTDSSIEQLTTALVKINDPPPIFQFRQFISEELVGLYIETNATLI